MTIDYSIINVYTTTHSPIYRWLLSGVDVTLAAARVLVLSGRYKRAGRLLSEARVWGLI